MVMFVVADLVLNDFLGDDFAKSEFPEEVPEEETIGEDTSDTQTSLLDSEDRGDEVTDDVDETDETSDPKITDIILLEDDISTAPESAFTTELLLAAGLKEPVLNTDPYKGLIYGFWYLEDDFSDFTVLTHTVFEGTTYVGTVYETQTSNSIETFDAYQTLRGFAEISEDGELNETNAYGEASFYFNHSTKTNTVFLTVQSKNTIFSFEYNPAYHAIIRTLLEKYVF